MEDTPTWNALSQLHTAAETLLYIKDEMICKVAFIVMSPFSDSDFHFKDADRSLVGKS